jgi:hypothetical protein
MTVPPLDARSSPADAADPNAPPPGSEIVEAALAREVVARLIRHNNLAIFLIVVAGLAAVAIVETQHLFQLRPKWMWMVTTLRIALPILALVLTAVLTSRTIDKLLAELGPRPITPALTMPAFYFSKLASIILLTATGLICSASLIFGHRAIDIALVLIPILLLFITRVNEHGPTVFAAFAQSQREVPPPTK